MRNYLLFYRVAIFNILALVGVTYAYIHGYVQEAVEKDVSHVTYAIIALVGLGVLSSLRRALNISYLVKERYNGPESRREVHRLNFVQNIAGWSVILGLIGNTIGFIVALSSPDALTAGANTAFAATAVGLSAALWMEANYYLLSTALSLHLED